MSLPHELIDKAFLQYQRTGNPEHLGEVFEETAPQLLRMALHLVPDVNTAEELLQATFLVAIEHRQDYKPTGHVLSWLFGILTNHARNSMRTAGRKIDAAHSLGTDPLELVDHDQQGPHKVLEGKELSQAVLEAIEKMPEKYQAVLMLHLRSGFSVGEIAISLRRSPGTVRKQITRGMEMLKKSLPASIIAGTAILTTPVHGLAAIQQVVMSKANAVAQSAAGSSSALSVGKLTLWTAAGTLTAAALAVSFYTPDVGQVTFDELSPKATASVVTQKGSVDSPATATVAMQEDPFPPSSRFVMAFSFPVKKALGGAKPMNDPSSFQNFQFLRIPSLLLGAMTLLPALDQAQSVIYIHNGENAGDNNGISVSGAGDVNSDGYADIVASANFWDADPLGTDGTTDDVDENGRVYAYSGKDGTTIWTRDGENAGDWLGTSVSGTGDGDSNGFPDVVAGAVRWDALGPDGTAGTVDDISNVGRAYVLSGKDGTTVWTFDGELVADGLGDSVSDAGDVDLDGFSDVIAGASFYDAAGPDGTSGTVDDISNVGRAYVLSGTTGTTLHTFTGENLFSSLGVSVSDAGDMDLDGFADVAVGSPMYSAGFFSFEGRVYAYSGKGGALIWASNGENGFDAFGASSSNAGDVNSDGYPDIVTGAAPWSDPAELGPDGTAGTGDETGGHGRAYVLSGKDGTTLSTFDGENAGDGLSFSVGGAGHVNSDANVDIVAGAIGWDADPLGPDGTDGTADDVDETGRVYVISSASLSLTADTHQLSLSVANSQTMTIDAGVANAGKNYWIFTGFAASGDTPGVTMAPGVVIPLNQPDPLTSFVIGLTQLGGGAPTFAGWKSTLDIAGKASPSLNTFGPTPTPLGITLHHAALVYTPDGCGVGCDTFQLATNWVPMTTTP